MENESAPLTHQEICCLKTALALVVVKRRFEAKQQAETAAAATDSKDAESTAVSLCPWLDQKSVPSDSFVPASENGDDWAHCNHMLKLAVQNAKMTASSGHRNHPQLQSLTTHLACQIVQLSKKEESAQHAAQEWIRSSLSQQCAEDNDAIFAVWHGILQAKPLEISALLVPILLNALRSALQSSNDDNNNNLWLSNQNPTHAVHLFNLLEQALPQSSNETLQLALEAFVDYLIPMSVANLAPQYQSMRRQSSAEPGSMLLLRFGVSTLIQKLLLSKNNYYM